MHYKKGSISVFQEIFASTDKIFIATTDKIFISVEGLSIWQ